MFSRSLTALQWYRCPKCRELNPPDVRVCTNARCRAKNPKYDVPKPPKPPKADKPSAPKPVWIIKLGVWMTVLTPLVLGATMFMPPPYNQVVRAAWAVVKQLIGMF